MGSLLPLENLNFRVHPGLGLGSQWHTSVAEYFVLPTLGPGLVNIINWLGHINMSRIAHIIVPAFSRLKQRQEDFAEFKDSQGYRITPLSKKEKTKSVDSILKSSVAASSSFLPSFIPSFFSFFLSFLVFL